MVLRELADRLRDGVRAGDVVGRIGGDEFVAICADADPRDGESIAERILDRRRRQPILLEGVAITRLDERRRRHVSCPTPTPADRRSAADHGRTPRCTARRPRARAESRWSRARSAETSSEAALRGWRYGPRTAAQATGVTRSHTKPCAGSTRPAARSTPAPRTTSVAAAAEAAQGRAFDQRRVIADVREHQDRLRVRPAADSRAPTDAAHRTRSSSPPANSGVSFRARISAVSPV